MASTSATCWQKLFAIPAINQYESKVGRYSPGTLQVFYRYTIHTLQVYYRYTTGIGTGGAHTCTRPLGIGIGSFSKV